MSFTLFPSFNSNKAIEHVNEEVNEEIVIPENLKDYITRLYTSLSLKDKGLEFDIFSKAITGYFTLKSDEKVSNQIISIADFKASSTKERLFVIDLENEVLLFQSYVSHGRNSGNEYARSFSNRHGSFQSSLGFFVTGERYHGKHGLSLFLDGQEEGVNCNARERAVVIHGADYASESLIRSTGRLGRSLGCPALPMDVSADIINTIADKSVFFIYANEKNYLHTSKLLKPETANAFFNQLATKPRIAETVSTTSREEQGQ